MNATRAVLKELDIPFRQDWSTDESGKSVWGKAVNSGNVVTLRGDNTPMEIVPDAVYMLESRGLKVKLEGVGRVVSQSIPPYVKYKKGQTIQIKLKR